MTKREYFNIIGVLSNLDPDEHGLLTIALARTVKALAEMARKPSLDMQDLMQIQKLNGVMSRENGDQKILRLIEWAEEQIVDIDQEMSDLP